MIGNQPIAISRAQFQPRGYNCTMYDIIVVIFNAEMSVIKEY